MSRGEDVTLRDHGPSDTSDGALVDEFMRVYRECFGSPPWCDTDEQITNYRQRLRDSSQRPGFRWVTAWSTTAMVGFAVAFTTAPQFPSGGSYDAIADAFPTDFLENQLCRCTEVDELAVVSAYRRQGIARRLMEAVATRPAWLITARKSGPAIQTYSRLGWSEHVGRTRGGDEVVIFTSP